MRHFIIASHSHLAEGMTSALELIVGKIENLNFYNAYIEEETGDYEHFKEKIIRKRGNHIMVKQNIVFVENTPGSLQKVTKILAENQIDIYGFGCFDAPEFANFRMVCDDPEKADQIMAENGYMTRITQAILVDLQDEIGGLDKLLSVMGDSNVNLHYIYTFFHRGLKVPVAIMHCEDLLVAESVLRNNGFKVLDRLVDPDGVEEA